MMSRNNKPLISLGIPVYNGENYMSEAIDSLLNQTYTNIEIIICDNASTDKTKEICQGYVTKDPRIKYHRNEANIGAAKNFNLLVDLAEGEYFKWMACDDICAPEYLERCVDALLEDPEVVWSHTRSVAIGEQSEFLRKVHWNIDLHSFLPNRRFADAILKNHDCLSVFGVIRIESLRKTDLIGNYIASDRTLIAQLSLLGRYGEIPIDSFYHREHSNRSTKSHASMKDRQRWFDPNSTLKFPNLKLFLEYFKSVRNSPIARRQKALCFLHIFRWVLRGGQNF